MVLANYFFSALVWLMKTEMLEVGEMQSVSLKSPTGLHEELRRRILNLYEVPNDGMPGFMTTHSSSGEPCSCTSTVMAIATFDCRKPIRGGFLRKAKRARTDGLRKPDTSRSL